jgi:hypothetical protein
MEPLIGVLIFLLIVVLLVWAAIYVIDRAFPSNIRWPAKLVVGVIALIAILYRLAPMAGI